MARLRKGRLRWAIAGVLVVALTAAVIVAWPLVQRYTGAAPPAQFYEKAELDPALAQDYTRVLGVAQLPAGPVDVPARAPGPVPDRRRGAGP